MPTMLAPPSVLRDPKPIKPLRMLPDRHGCVQQIAGDWLVVRTIPHHEKQVVRALAEWDEDYFFPFTTESRRYGSTVRTVEIPMAQGYVFATPDARDRLNESYETARHLVARSCRYITVHPAERSRFVSDLANLQIIADASGRGEDVANAVLHPLRVRGKRVQVIEGKYNGLDAEVIGWNGKMALVQVSVLCMGDALVREIEEAYLSPVD